MSEQAAELVDQVEAVLAAWLRDPSSDSPLLPEWAFTAGVRYVARELIDLLKVEFATQDATSPRIDTSTLSLHDVELTVRHFNILYSAGYQTVAEIHALTADPANAGEGLHGFDHLKPHHVRDLLDRLVIAGVPHPDDRVARASSWWLSTVRP